MTDYQLTYKPDGEVIKQFMRDNSFFRGLRGPVGSGKSVSCCIEIFRRALQQKPNDQGIRKSRWAVVRNTNPQLKTTTIKTWLDWFPENEWGLFNRSVPYSHHIKKQDLDLECIFLALDRPEDTRRLLSLELTGIWVNEARELSKGIIDACTMRVGRYPSIRDGGPSWYGVICDTNAPEEDHWWPIMAGEAPLPDHIRQEEALMLIKPDNWNFFTQPSGMSEIRDRERIITGYERNKVAENTSNLTPEYYSNIITGKTRGWIDVYVMNKLGTVEEGKPVYPDFNELVHIPKEEIKPHPQLPVFVGMDFGLTPAAVFGQKLARGRWVIISELVCQDMGTMRFAELVKHELATVYANQECQIYGDPAGDVRAQTDETTPFQILRAAGLRAIPAPSNDVVLRIDSVEQALTRMSDGNPCFLVNRKCRVLARGFTGGYHYKRLNVSGDRFEDRPLKDRYSHIHDALQYLMLGGGEGRSMVRTMQGAKPFVAKRDFNPFDRNNRKKKKQWNRLSLSGY